jgi:hypothetical protein
MHKKQRGKQNKAGNNLNIKTFPIKIKILLAYLKNYCTFGWLSVSGDRSIQEQRPL